MKNTYDDREKINDTIWKQQNVIEFINEILGDIYLDNTPESLKRMEVRLTAITILIDNLKSELHTTIQQIQQQQETLIPDNIEQAKMNELNWLKP